jgi:hypothetical protein
MYPTARPTVRQLPPLMPPSERLPREELALLPRLTRLRSWRALERQDGWATPEQREPGVHRI